MVMSRKPRTDDHGHGWPTSGFRKQCNGIERKKGLCLGGCTKNSNDSGRKTKRKNENAVAAESVGKDSVSQLSNQIARHAAPDGELRGKIGLFAFNPRHEVKRLDFILE
jgi:hypothetical protein